MVWPVSLISWCNAQVVPSNDDIEIFHDTYRYPRTGLLFQGRLKGVDGIVGVRESRGRVGDRDRSQARQEFYKVGARALYVPKTSPWLI